MDLSIQSRKTFGLSATIILIAIIYKLAFEGGSPTCKNYLTNTYLYLALGCTLIGLFTNSLPSNISNIGLFPTIVLMFIFIIWFSLTPATNVLGTHILWFIVILMFGILFAPLINQSSGDTIIYGLLMTTMLFVAMTVVAIIFENEIKGHLGKIGIALLITLIIIILFEFFAIFTGFYTRQPAVRRAISYFVIFVFCIYLIYDTVSIRKRAGECSKNNPANYPRESMDLILDLINIFARFLGSGR